VSELPVTSIEFLPLVIQRDDCLNFPVQQAMDGMPARRLIGERCFALPGYPSVGSSFLQFEVGAGVSEIPSLACRIGD
jgi:hypothetical protein